MTVIKENMTMHECIWLAQNDVFLIEHNNGGEKGWATLVVLDWLWKMADMLLMQWPT